MATIDIAVPLLFNAPSNNDWFFFSKNLQTMIVFLRFYGTPTLLHITIIMTHESLFFDVEGAN